MERKRENKKKETATAHSLPGWKITAQESGRSCVDGRKWHKNTETRTKERGERVPHCCWWLCAETDAKPSADCSFISGGTRNITIYLG